MTMTSIGKPAGEPAGGLYTYEAVDTAGKVRTGTVEADSEAAALARLSRQGFTPLQVAVKPTGGLNRELRLPGRVGIKDVALMSRQAATMVGAGLPLLKVLGILAEQSDSRPMTDALNQVRTEVASGASLSDALARNQRVFPPLMTNMVRAGEAGGFLDEALVRVADNFEAEVKLRQKVRSALTYPVAVLVIAILLVTAMLLFIVPRFRDLYASLGGVLPLPTRVLVLLSDIMVWAAPIGLVVLGILAFVWFRIRHQRRVREVVDPIKIRVPVFGKLFRKVYIARMTRNMSSMLSSGVPMLQTIDIVSETTGSTVVADALDDVRDSVRAGEPLASPMSRHAIFPPMLVQMVAVGEDAGQLDQMVDKVADFYDAEVESQTEALTTLLEPVMILVMGCIVGFIVISLYLPIFRVFNLIGNG